MREKRLATKEMLKQAGLRPTRQRMSLANLLFDGGDRHVTAEQLHIEAEHEDVKVSLATVYNTLNQFTDAGLLREVVVDSSKSYFDTNTSDHHHYYHENKATLEDIPNSDIVISALPHLPENLSLSRVDVIIRVKENS